MKFRTILLDPPWWYADQKKVRKDTKEPTRGIGACHHYAQMKTDELATLDLESVMADRCHVYLWATSPLLPDAFRLLEAWKLHWATVAFVWLKANPRQYEKKIFTMDDLGHLFFFGPGYYTGSNVELVLLGTRGQPFHFAKGCKGSQIVLAPRLGHSEKPDEVQRRIAWMYPDATPRLELFARRSLDGWTCVGNEAPDTPGEDIRTSLEKLVERVGK